MSGSVVQRLGSIRRLAGPGGSEDRRRSEATDVGVVLGSGVPARPAAFRDAAAEG
ncbi:MAG TPA: hypothetical protein VIV06_02325 [Candidatus Limnocylindrales bacterium]